MHWLITAICGSCAIIAGILSVRYGNKRFRMREFWLALATFFLGIISLFFAPWYITSVCWLITSGAALISVIRTFRHRNDKKVFKKPEIRTIETTERMGEIIPINSPHKTPEPPKTA